MCSLCRLPVTKNRNFWTNFDNFGRSCTNPLLPMRAKFGVLEQTQGLHLPAKFHLNVFIVSASVGQSPQFWVNVDIFVGSCTDRFYRWGSNLVCYDRLTVYAYVPNFVSIGLFCRPLLATKPIFAVFWTSAFSGVAKWQQSEKVGQGAQLQTFPYPTVSKSFLYSNAFMAKSGVRKRDEQTNRQTKRKTQRFWPPRRPVKSEPHQTWHGDRGPRARSCTSKTFPDTTHSFAARGRSKFWGEPDPLNLKPP